MTEQRGVHITNTHGRVIYYRTGRCPEPEPASVVLVNGIYGDAWQRYFSDGLWHRGKYRYTWEQMLRERNMVLVYDAPVRSEHVVCPGCGYADNHDRGQCPALPAGVRS